MCDPIPVDGEICERNIKGVARYTWKLHLGSKYLAKIVPLSPITLFDTTEEAIKNAEMCAEEYDVSIRSWKQDGKYIKNPEKPPPTP